jgi:hypothetical protein
VQITVGELRTLSISFLWNSKSDSSRKWHQNLIFINTAQSGHIWRKLHFTFELPHLPFLNLDYDWDLISKLTVSHLHGEHSWWECGCWDRSTGWALVASVNLVLSHHINSWVKGWADRVAAPPRDQFQPRWHRGWQYLRSSMKLLCGIPSHPTANLHGSKWPIGSRSLALHHRVQVWAPQLYRKSEDVVCSLAVARRCQSMVSQLYRHSLG